MSIRSLRAGWLCILALALVTSIVPSRAEAGATIDGQYADLGLLGAGVTTVLPVLNRGGVPGDATAVTLNVTSDGSLAAGFVTVYPCGSARPNASNLNFAAGATVANAVTSKVGAGGAVCIYNQSPTHLIVDVNGYHASSSRYQAIDPARLADTRRSSATASAEDVMLVLVNQLRASRGVGPVASDATMTAYARNWSYTMSQSEFRHSSGPYSENIGWLRGSYSPESAAVGLYNAFLASAPHLANMTSAAWSRIGVGMYQNGTTWYVALEFR